MTQPTAETAPHDGMPLVITLCSTSVPMMLQLPLLSVFAGLTVFRSRAIEEGRERFRMHLGYFHDRERAMKVLVAARRFYPGAFLAAAPRDGMGSLDDTLNTRFAFARGPVTRLVAAEQLPSADEFQAALASASPRGPEYDDATGADERDARDERLEFGDDMRAEHEFWARAGADEREAGEREAPRVATVTLDDAAPVLDAPAALPVFPAPSDAAADRGATHAARDRGGPVVQRYAVQLQWSLSPVDPRAVPQHALFRQFTLYGVTVRREEAAEHGLRLGFFSNLYSAKQVADYVRHDFAHACVVPVSEREMVRAQQAAWNDLLARVGVRSRGASRPANDEAPHAPVRRDFGLRRLWGRQG